MKYALLFYLVMTVVTFVLYGTDKRKAKKHRWRTPEAVLLGCGLAGGFLGALIGMKLFRHKTRHLYFWIINVLSAVLHAALFYYWFFVR